MRQRAQRKPLKIMVFSNPAADPSYPVPPSDSL
jgi:hypothetical protein